MIHSHNENHVHTRPYSRYYRNMPVNWRQSRWLDFSQASSESTDSTSGPFESWSLEAGSGATVSANLGSPEWNNGTNRADESRDNVDGAS